MIYTKVYAANVDRYTDCNHRHDTFWLDNAAFTKLGRGSELKPMKLKADTFHEGRSAADAQDRIIYNPDNSGLYYDKDGAGGARQIKFATLPKGLDLNSSDFWVV